MQLRLQLEFSAHIARCQLERVRVVQIVVFFVRVEQLHGQVPVRVDVEYSRLVVVVELVEFVNNGAVRAEIWIDDSEPADERDLIY